MSDYIVVVKKKKRMCDQYNKSNGWSGNPVSTGIQLPLGFLTHFWDQHTTRFFSALQKTGKVLQHARTSALSTDRLTMVSPAVTQETRFMKCWRYIPLVCFSVNLAL